LEVIGWVGIAHRQVNIEFCSNDVFLEHFATTFRTDFSAVFCTGSKHLVAR
jgi:hypothetical protein